MRLCSVDRLEDKTAVLLFDDGEERIINIKILDFLVEEGMILKETDGVFLLDRTETKRRKNEASALLKKILNKNQRI